MKAQPFGNEIMVTNAFPLCRNMNVCTLKLKKSFKGESLTFVGFYTTDFRPVSVQEKLFCFFCEGTVVVHVSPSCLPLAIGGQI